MTQCRFLNRFIILSFMSLAGFCLAKGISAGSLMGILLALVSLGAGIYFLYILAAAQRDRDAEKADL